MSDVVYSCSSKCVQIEECDVDVNKPFTSGGVSSKDTVVYEETLPFSCDVNNRKPSKKNWYNTGRNASTL